MSYEISPARQRVSHEKSTDINAKPQGLGWIGAQDYPGFPFGGDAFGALDERRRAGQWLEWGKAMKEGRVRHEIQTRGLQREVRWG